MKNYKVKPADIVDLVNKTTVAFKVWESGLERLSQKEKSEYMHFMSDMLDDLISTAYPLEEKKVNTGAESVVSALNKGYEARAKATKDFGSPIDSVIFSKALSAAIENQAKKNRVSELDKQFEAVARVARNMKPPTPPSPLIDIHESIMNKILRGDK